MQYTATLSLLDLCEGTERTPGARFSMQWWYQADINLAGTMEMAAAVAEVEEDGVEE